MKTLEILNMEFSQVLPATTGMYLVLEKSPPAGVDEYFCNPFLCRINVDSEGNAWVQYSMEWAKQQMTPRDWHPIPANCGWWFSGRIKKIEMHEQ